MNARRKDFHRKQLRNPYFGKPEKKAARVSPRLLLGFFVIFVGGGLGYLGMSGAFAVTSVEVSGTNLISSQEVQALANQQIDQRRFFVLPQRVIYFFSKNQLANALKKQYALDELVIDKDYPHTISIEITERQPAFIWITGQDKYYADEDAINLLLIANEGVSYKTGTSTELIRPNAAILEYPLVYDELQEPAAAIGSPVLTDTIMKPLGEIIKSLTDRTNVIIARYVVNRSTREITAVTQAGWQIRFSADKPVADQINLVEVALRDTIKDTKNLQYIDVRFGDKIFYR